MTDTLKNEFWDRIEKAGPGMLSAGDAQAVPMTHQSGRDEGALWFITARDTALATAAKGGAQSQYLVASDSANLYARIDGALRTVTDKAKLDELWSAFAAAWFEDGKHDPDVQLIRFEPARAGTIPKTWPRTPLTMGSPGRSGATPWSEPRPLCAP